MRKKHTSVNDAMADGAAAFGLVSAQDGRRLELVMQDLRLTGRVLPVGARLVVRYLFVSGESCPVEAVYTFMLPRDAAIRRFVVRGPGYSARSELEPVQKARRQYEDGLAQGHLGVLTQQYRDGCVNLNVGNLKPEEPVAVYMEIVAGVELHDDGLRFRFPFTLAPGYHPRMRAAELDDGQGEIELPEDEFGDVLLPPYRKEAAGLHAVGFSLAVDAPAELVEVASVSHPVKVRALKSPGVTSKDSNIH